MRRQFGVRVFFTLVAFLSLEYASAQNRPANLGKYYFLNFIIFRNYITTAKLACKKTVFKTSLISTDSMFDITIKCSGLLSVLAHFYIYPFMLDLVKRLNEKTCKNYAISRRK